MKWVWLGALFAATFVVGFFTLVMWSRAAGEVATFREWGVCIDAPSPEYSIEGSMPADFYLVDVTAPGGRGMRVYIGNYPQLDASVIATGRAASGSFVAVPGRDNQFVAVEPGTGALIVHVMLAAGGDRERLLEGVRFCGNDPS